MPLISARQSFSIACLLLIGCTKEPKNNPPSPSASVSPQTTSTSSRDCATIQAAYNSELARSANACTTDADCTCFNGGITKEHGCGGVTDKATAAKLEAITSDARAHNCGAGIMCAAWACSPICKTGKCENGPNR